MKSSELSWLSAHLYYNGSLDKLLVDGVCPFIRSIQLKQEISCYFFIRYWEKGPHIRLRVQARYETLKSYIQPELKKWFTNYFKSYPSDNLLPQASYKDVCYYPMDSIQFFEYEPEVERYGGHVAVQIAEEQFMISSQATLKAIQDSAKWNYDRALGVAIQMHLGFAQRLAMRSAEAHAFFSNVLECWLPPPNSPKAFTSEDTTGQREELLQLFAQSFNKQASKLCPFFNYVWHRLEVNETFEQSWFQRWLDGMQYIYEQLLECQRSDVFEPPSNRLSSNYPPFSHAQISRWAICTSYVHMTNNRLGIFNHDEGYLCYIIQQMFRQII